MNRTIALPALALFLASGAGAAFGDVLDAGEVLRVRFTADGGYTPTPDTLLFVLGTTTVPVPFTSRTAELFDGNLLLGSHSDSFLGNATGAVPLDPSNAFIEAGSSYTLLDPTVIDFTMILDGTIDGRIDFTVETGSMDIDFTQVQVKLLEATGPNVGQLVSPQPVITSILIFDPDVGTSFCPGDGTGTPCPCGNTGGAGEGCANSSGAGGVLFASGSLGVGADDLRFEATNLAPGQPALLFVGELAVNNGDGIVFGDGLRCAGMHVVRLGVAVPDGGGSASWGPGLGTQGGWGNGDTRYFQGWYRDPSGSSCGAQFNLTQGIEATFTP